MLSVPAIKDRDDREEADADDRIETDEPGSGEFVAHEDEVELLVAPDEVGVKDLVVRNDRHGHDRDEQNERENGAPVARGELWLWDRRNSGKARVVVTRSQIFLAREINADGEQHADPSRGKAVMPADFLSKRPDNER